MKYNLEEKSAVGLLQTLSLRALFENSRQSHKKKQNDHQGASDVKKQKANISLVKSHMSILPEIKITKNQEIKLNPKPNSTTGVIGLSSEGTKMGTTVEPKNKVPMLLKISANLSSWKFLNKFFGNRILSIITKIYKDFNGQIDDVKIYNYALTGTQVVNLYNEGSAVRFGPSTGSP